MKTAISIPDPLFKAAESVAKRLKIPRSQLYTRAISEYLRHHRHRDVKEALDALYAVEDSGLDPVLEAMQMASLAPEEW